MLPILTIGQTQIDFNKVSDANVAAMLRRGANHYFGNEQAAKVGPNSSFVTKFKKENGRDPTEAEIEAQKKINLEKALDVLMTGEVGAGRGPKLDPVEAEMERIAVREIRDILAGAGLVKANRIPKDDDEFTFPDGTFTFETLVERRLANETNGPRIQKEAEKRVADEKRKREAAAKKAAEASAQGPVSTSALGL